MNAKKHARSGSLDSRVLIILLLCAVTSSIVAGTLLGFFRPETQGGVSQRTLTFAERVAYQRAIEDVYWRHRIWPTENPDAKPPLNAVMSQAQLEKKVTDYLSNSQALEDYWQWPITAEQMQAEMDRMARHTKQSEVLRELFEALGNDPFVIAECLARPILAERLIANLSAHNKTNHAQSARSDRLPGMSITATSANGAYTLPKISEGTPPCIDDTWIATSTTNAPTARSGHTAVWTGSEMIVWGGGPNTGGRYNPSTDSWTATSITNAPDARFYHTAVWTGNEMIVWGGSPNGFGTGAGGRYNPITDSWTATSTTNAPSSRGAHTAVWTGSEMIIWGGADIIGRYFNTGGKYNPSTDSWISTSTTNAPAARRSHTAVWTGSEMIVWGGYDGSSYLNTGGRYDPGADSWEATSTTNTPTARGFHTAVWTDSRMIVWGGACCNTTDFNTGGRYDPITDSWTPIGTTNAPEARAFHTAVLVGNAMVIWGGGHWIGNDFILLNSGGRYDPSTGGWTATSTINAPSARYAHTAVSTSDEMIVWGGTDNITSFSTGGRYCAQTGAPTPTPTPTVTATASATPAATPTATATLTPKPTSTPRPTPTPRIAPTPRARPTSAPRP